MTTPDTLTPRAAAARYRAAVARVAETLAAYRAVFEESDEVRRGVVRANELALDELAASIEAMARACEGVAEVAG